MRRSHPPGVAIRSLPATDVGVGLSGPRDIPSAGDRRTGRQIVVRTPCSSRCSSMVPRKSRPGGVLRLSLWTKALSSSSRNRRGSYGSNVARANVDGEFALTHGIASTTAWTSPAMWNTTRTGGAARGSRSACRGAASTRVLLPAGSRLFDHLAWRRAARSPSVPAGSAARRSRREQFGQQSGEVATRQARRVEPDTTVAGQEVQSQHVGALRPVVPGAVVYIPGQLAVAVVADRRLVQHDHLIVRMVREHFVMASSDHGWSPVHALPPLAERCVIVRSGNHRAIVPAALDPMERRPVEG